MFEHAVSVSHNRRHQVHLDTLEVEVIQAVASELQGFGSLEVAHTVEGIEERLGVFNYEGDFAVLVGILQPSDLYIGMIWGESHPLAVLPGFVAGSQHHTAFGQLRSPI